jgi:hypothetical protein
LLALIAFAVVGGCTAPLHGRPAPDMAGATCAWIVSVNPPSIDASGNGCTIRALAAPSRVSLVIALGGGHTLAIDSDDPIPGDPYGRVEPPIVVDGTYVPCGSGATGKTTVNIGAGIWSVKADFSACQQAVTARAGGTLPLHALSVR